MMTVKQLLLASVALLALQGCTNGLEHTTTFSGDWTQEEQAQVSAGFAEWGMDTGTIVAYKVEGACQSDKDIGPTSVMYGETFPSTNVKQLSHVNFYTDCMKEHNADLQKVAAHEAGHALGLEHTPVDGPDSLMKASNKNQASEPTQFDIDNAKAAQQAQ